MLDCTANKIGRGYWEVIIEYGIEEYVLDTMDTQELSELANDFQIIADYLAEATKDRNP